MGGNINADHIADPPLRTFDTSMRYDDSQKIDHYFLERWGRGNYPRYLSPRSLVLIVLHGVPYATTLESSDLFT